MQHPSTDRKETTVRWELLVSLSLWMTPFPGTQSLASVLKSKYWLEQLWSTNLSVPFSMFLSRFVDLCASSCFSFALHFADITVWSHQVTVCLLPFRSANNDVCSPVAPEAAKAKHPSVPRNIKKNRKTEQQMYQLLPEQKPVLLDQFEM